MDIEQQNKPTEGQPVAPTTTNHRKNSSGKYMIVVVVVVIVLIVIGILIANRSNKSKNAAVNKGVTITQPSKLQPGEVSITKTSFVPATITIKVDQAVVWTNNDSAPHIVASDPYPNDNKLPGLNSKQNISPGDTYSYIFDTAGTYTYHDNLNPLALKGTVIVKQ